MDKAAASRALQHGVEVEIKFESRFPRGPNGEILPMYEVATGCTARGGDRAAALTDLENFLTPAPVREIEAWIAELDAITAGRRKEGFDAELLLTAYASRLHEYPADIARHALLDRRWKWFPTWAELGAVCDSLSSPRRLMISTLRSPEPKMEEERRLATPDEKERIAALIAEKFPDVPQHWREAAGDAVTKGYVFKGAAE